MGRLTYSMLGSLDGYTADRDGRFDWAVPDEYAHAFINERERPIGTYLYGRRMYETMRVWETDEALADGSPAAAEYAAIWRAADKIVFSSTLDDVDTGRTRIERAFHPDAVRRLVAESDTDVSIGGPLLAARALRAGLVDELTWFTMPVVVGGGTPFTPPDLHCDLTLLEEQRIGNAVYQRYRVDR